MKYMLLMTLLTGCAFFGANKSTKTQAVELCLTTNRESYYKGVDTADLWRWCSADRQVESYSRLVGCLS